MKALIGELIQLTFEMEIDWGPCRPGDFMTPFDDYERAVASVFAEYVSVRDSASLVWSTTNPYPKP